MATMPRGDLTDTSAKTKSLVLHLGQETLVVALVELGAVNKISKLNKARYIRYSDPKSTFVLLIIW